MTRKIARANVPGLRQRTQYTCGATSLTAALQALGKNVTEDQVNKIMGASPGRGVRWEEILATTQYFGCRGTLVVPATLGQLKKWTGAGNPVIIAWNPESRPWSHVSVVLDVDEEENIYIMDPNIPDPEEFYRIVPRKEFFKAWGEQWGDRLIVRRPGMMVELEIDQKGRQIMASTSLERLRQLRGLTPGGDPDASDKYNLLSKRRRSVILPVGESMKTGSLHISRESTRIFVRDLESGKVFTVLYDSDFARNQSHEIDKFVASLHGNSFREAERSAFDFTHYTYDNYPDAEVSFVNKIYRSATMSNRHFPCISTEDMERRLNANFGDWMEDEDDEMEDDKEGRHEKGKSVDVPKWLRSKGHPEAAKKWESENARNRDRFKSARHRKGVPVDVAAWLREKGHTEAADKWEAMNEEHRDNFKSASDDLLKTAYGPLHYQDQISRLSRAPGGLYGYKKSTQRTCESAAKRVYKFAQKLAKQIYGKDERVSQFLSMHSERSSSLPAKIIVSAMRELGPKFATEKIGYVGRHVKFRDQYLKDFFAEKNIPERTFTVTDRNGVPHMIPNDVVVEHIALAKGRELEGIKNTLRQIDFRNGDVNHFLEHLAKGIADQATGRFASEKSAARRRYGLYGFPERTAQLGLGACSDLRAEVGRIAYELHTKKADALPDLTGFFQNHSKQGNCQASQILLASFPGK